MNNDYVIIIPARFASQRYPGKPLVNLTGAGGESRSLIHWSWQAACDVAGAQRVWVATDDDRIAAEVTGFGGQIVMTPVSCANGTERCASAMAKLGAIAEIVVNFQGDAPLTPRFVVEGIVKALRENSDIEMITPAVRCSRSAYDHLLADQAEGRVGGTTVVFNDAGQAIYFSKRVLPHIPDNYPDAYQQVFMHLGVYAFRAAALKDYAASPPSRLELLEGLEQLRFIEARRPVGVVKFEPIGWDCIELNNPSDVAAIERILSNRSIA